MPTASIGSKSGTVSFGNYDADEGPFDFNLSGEVTRALVIDDGDAVGYSDSGNLLKWNQGYQNDVREAVNGGAANSAAFAFGNLAAGTYRISAT